MTCPGRRQAARVTTNERGGPRRAIHETAGSVDHPFDDDRPASHPLIQTDAACSIPWLAGGFQAVEVFVDPALRDRTPDICQTLSGICTQHDDLDALNQSIQDYAERNEMSAGVYERPPDRLTEEVVAVAFTLG